MAGAAKRGSEGAPRYAVRAPDVTIEEVVNPHQREEFSRFPLDLYAGDTKFVPPIVAERREFIDPSINPFFQHARGAFFLARRNGKVVGRIAAVNDSRYNDFHDSDLGFFGMFESLNDPGIAAALFETAGRWVRLSGPQKMIGPLNLSFHHDVGCLVDGFDRSPSMMMPYNPRYYAKLFEVNGFTKCKDLWSYELLASEPMPDKVARFAERVRTAGGITIRRIDLRDEANERRRIKNIYDSMLKPGWGFAPISDVEFDAAVSRLRPLIALRPELCLVAEANGEAVGFGITVPDTNVAQKTTGGYLSRFGVPIGLAKMLWAARKIDSLRVLMFGIKQGWRRRGIDALLAVETMQQARKLGYVSGELGWTVEDDKLINRTIQATGARRIKTYRIFERAI
jgi:GNAT superfamily N-acetyltransferase